MTKQDAVNFMLGVIGLPPVSNIIDTGISEIDTAILILDGTTANVLERGFQAINREIQEWIPEDITDHILKPANVLFFDTTGGENYTQRGDEIYNVTDKTFEFTDPIEVDVILSIPFEDLPHFAQSYIQIKAARIFQTRVISSNTTHNFTAAEEEEAYYNFMELADSYEDNNFISGDQLANSFGQRGK